MGQEQQPQEHRRSISRGDDQRDGHFGRREDDRLLAYRVGEMEKKLASLDARLFDDEDGAIPKIRESLQAINQERSNWRFFIATSAAVMGTLWGTVIYFWGDKLKALFT